MQKNLQGQHREAGIALVTALLVLLLISSIIVGLVWLTMTDQQLGGNNGDRQLAFYGAEAGMEKLTADVGALFGANYAPTAAEVNALTLVAPTINGVQYLAPDGTSGYQISFTPDGRGNPLAQTSTIHSGPYNGLVALITPYILTVTSRAKNSSEVKFTRNIETVGIPVFQFGMFSQTDLSFFAGPNFNFGGRIHTNGNLWLAEGDGSTLTLSDKITAVGEVIRTNLSNGWLTTSRYNGAVNISTVPNGTTYIPLTMGQGSLVGTLGTGLNEPTWTQVSLGTYNGEIRNGRTGATPLVLTIAAPALGGQPVDMIRRPVQGEDSASPAKLGERYYAQASLRVLLSDEANPSDINGLPCLDTSVAPVALSTLGVPAASLPVWYTAGIPLPTSNAASPGQYTAADGYWISGGKPVITGLIKIEVQTSYGTPCGAWKDVTKEILNLGFAGRNLNPLSLAGFQSTCTGPPAALVCTGAGLPHVPPIPAAQLSPSACVDPSPNAVIRLARVRDNPSTAAPNGGCSTSAVSTDYWPNALFDTREGLLRDACPNGSSPCTANPTLGGAMYYVELDARNLGRWLSGAIGTSGPLAKDPSNAPNDFVVYFSDRRGNYTAAPIAGGWPPGSPSGHETGEYGSFDFVNPSSGNGCPNANLDTGEDPDGIGGAAPLTYGQAPYPYAAGFWLPSAPALTANPQCTVATPSATWPGLLFTQAQDARENPPIFFRRALKIVNGSTINLGVCPGGVNCGLTIASENPVYVQGDFNSPGGGFNSPYGATAIVADAITLLSDAWNDVNSFASPYGTGQRQASTTTYRFGAAAGKGFSFPQAAGTGQDFGTDGGVHNFLRLLENWGGQTMNYRGSIVNLFYNRQAVGTFKCCSTVYSPPTRADNFDTDFLTPTLLPPRTPMFRDVNTIGFSQLILPTQ